MLLAEELLRQSKFSLLNITRISSERITTQQVLHSKNTPTLGSPPHSPKLVWSSLLGPPPPKAASALHTASHPVPARTPPHLPEIWKWPVDRLLPNGLSGEPGNWALSQNTQKSLFACTAWDLLPSLQHSACSLSGSTHPSSRALNTSLFTVLTRGHWKKL